jgi:EamA domain-containing membrane protein RarD
METGKMVGFLQQQQLPLSTFVAVFRVIWSAPLAFWVLTTRRQVPRFKAQPTVSFGAGGL